LELIRGLHNLKPRHRGCAVTIGNFDGVHRGHRAVLVRLKEAGGDLPRTLVTFEPHPREFLRPQSAPARLSETAEKLTLLAETGLERVLQVRFNAAFAALDPKAFVDTVLVRGLDARVVVVGDDFRFGRGGTGDFDLLTREGARNGFAVERLETLGEAGARVSSSRIRELLAAGHLDEASLLLGGPYCIQGRVAYGRQLGRTIGFPTANLPLTDGATPVSGVFSVRVRRAGQPGIALPGVALPGVANVGRRPTVNGEGITLEVHLFDFAESLYGERIRVELVSHIRPEKKFESLDALKAQIAADAATAREQLGVAE
jgi:riboflavin kinase/FMN adenylyltransferase